MFCSRRIILLGTAPFRHLTGWRFPTLLDSEAFLVSQTNLLASDQFEPVRGSRSTVVIFTRFSTVNILDGSNQTFSSDVWNGHLGLFLDPRNTTAIAQHLLTQLHQSSSLLNPVIGMRFDPANPKLTVGALDPNDYEGTINWVQLNENPDPNGDYFNTFSFDGVKGYDGQFVQFNESLTAALDSCEYIRVVRLD